MSRLVRFTPGRYSRLVRVAGVNPYARTALAGYRAASFAYRNRGALSFASRMARRMIRRPARRRRRRAPLDVGRQAVRRIGRPIGTASSRSNSVKRDNYTFGSRRLQSVDLINIPENPAGDEVNERDRRIANVSGIKLCMELRNATSDIQQDCLVNVACIIPKNEDEINGSVDSIPAVDFFRSNDSNRETDANNSLASTEWHCLPINSDKYSILFHKRFHLTRASSNNAPTDSIVLERWIKIGRQVTFRPGAFVPDKSAYLVYWCDYAHTPPNDQGVPQAMQAQIRWVTYFRRPRG